MHTVRARENFHLTGRPVHGELVRAYGTVKLAAALTNRDLGVWAADPAKADAIERACREVADGLHDDAVIVERLQGGAGTSTNMNVNEVIANRALELLGEPHGAYGRVSPLDDVNLHQSTNDTFPTALHLAAIRLLHDLEEQVLALQEAFQAKEKEFAHVVKVGRTQYPGRGADHPRPRDGRLRRSRSTATAGASTNARSGCASSISAAPPSAPASGRRGSTSSGWSTRCASSPRSASRAPRT